MATVSLNSENLFDQAKYSDVTFKYGTREFQAHRIIVCEKSEHFDQVLSTKGSATDGHAIVVLGDDDEDVVDAMFRWMYSFDYRATAPQARRSDWRFHLSVYHIALKYMVKGLMQQTTAMIRQFLSDATLGEVLDVYETLEDNSFCNSWAKRICARIDEVGEHMPRLDAMLKRDPELGAALVRKLVAELAKTRNVN